MGIDLGAIIEGGTGLGMTIAGVLAQGETQDKINAHRKTRKDYTVPGSIEEQLALLRQRSQQGLPGEDVMAGQIRQGTAQGVAASREASTSAADLLGATTNLYGQQTQALSDLQIQSARQQASNQLDYAQGLGTHAQYQDKAFTYNEAIPYQTRLNELMGIQQGNWDMITGGIATIADSGANYGSSGGDSGGGMSI